MSQLGFDFRLEDSGGVCLPDCVGFSARDEADGVLKMCCTNPDHVHDRLLFFVQDGPFCFVPACFRD